MTDSPSPRTFALKRIAERALAEAQACDFRYGRPHVRTLCGSNIAYEAVTVERGIFELSVRDGSSASTSYVPTEMIVFIHSLTFVGTET